MTAPLLSEEKRDALQELVNVGMGAAGAALARVLSAFVELSVPSVEVADRRRLATLFDAGAWSDGELCAVRQPFFGSITGESLMLFDGGEVARLADLVGGAPAVSVGQRHEMLLDLGNVVIGACVNNIAEPLQEVVSFGAPSVVTGRSEVCGFALRDSGAWQRGLLINVDFRLEAKSFRSRVLVFLSEQSLTLVGQALTRLLAALAAN
ncbi:MAG TPA: chemotaxis protein CheC [Polyangia bacterium]|nr:chemotaxis protein CheC [Polyangia bacterium]